MDALASQLLQGLIQGFASPAQQLLQGRVEAEVVSFPMSLVELRSGAGFSSVTLAPTLALALAPTLTLTLTITLTLSLTVSLQVHFPTEGFSLPVRPNSNLTLT